MQERDAQVETPELRLDCAGLTVGDFSVPSFQVQAGQAVCLHVPPYPAIWHENLKPILSGRVAHPALHLHGSVSYLERPMPRRRWWGWLHNPSARQWLTAEQGLTPKEAAAVLDLADWPEDLSIGHCSCNDRPMLVLEACLLRPPDLLVFDTCGNDWLTAHRIFARLASRTPSFALLYLKTPQRPDGPCLPGAVCLEMVRAPAPATIVEYHHASVSTNRHTASQAAHCPPA
jgi:hypothetical protein